MPQQKNKARAADKKDAVRAKISQTDIPSFPLTEALRIPQAIDEHYGFKPTKPINLAAAVKMAPNSSRFRMLCGAAVAYGVTSGGPNAPEISITPLGMRIVRTTVEGDDFKAKREAFLKPRVVAEFIGRYEDAQIPREDIGKNVLQEMGVPKERTQEVLELITSNAVALGFVVDIKGKQYISLEGTSLSGSADEEQEDEPSDSLPYVAPSVNTRTAAPVTVKPSPATPLSSDIQRALRRVYVTHGKNRHFIEPIKKLLTFGELEAVISVERPSVSQPVSDKIMGEMRSCGSAIIHVDAELKLMDSDASEHYVLNSNVLLEIGAAQALYGRRFILLVRDGIKLPSNLQGLFEVRYSGETLDGDATVRLLEAIRDIKNHPMPERYSATTA